MRVRLEGEKAQDAFGRRIGVHISPPCVLFLQGNLGTGKTTLVRGVLRGLGHFGPVRSPTYTLLEPYELAAMHLFHLDLYRLSDPEELELLGLRDLLEPTSVLMVEWPDRGHGFLPSPDLSVHIDHAGEARELKLVAETSPGAELLERLQDTG